MPIYTVGHSNHTSEAFVTLLRTHGVTALADVRSAPYSRFNPQFNRETLARALEAQGIRYVFLGRELGARPDDPGCYEEGRVRYARLARTALFRRGLDRVADGARRHRLALMCAEKEPLDCHRTILVARELVRRGIDVAHILADGRIEPHDDTVERLLARHGLDQPHLFAPPEDRIEQAFDAQAAALSYTSATLRGATSSTMAFDAQAAALSYTGEDAGGRTREGGRHPARRDPIRRVDEDAAGSAPDPADPDVVTPDVGHAHGRAREPREPRPCD